MVHLPTLSMLQTFETVVRRLSFALAAQELHLSSSAVSHQISKLEGIVGAPLLHRDRRGARTTPLGELYLQRILPALRIVETAGKDLVTTDTKLLHIHASPSIASLWLMPRLPGFVQAHPGISLHLSASPTHSAFTAGEPDIDIRYGLSNWAHLEAELLFSEPVRPLTSPALAKDLAMQCVSDMLQAPLIHSSESLVQWHDWLHASGVEAKPNAFSLRFDRAQLSLDAAAQGLGIALESTIMAAPYLADGRLVALFPAHHVVAAQGHFAVYPTSHALRPQVATFIDWLRQQASDCV